MSESPWPVTVRWLLTIAVAVVLGWASLQASQAVRTWDAQYWGLQILRIWNVPSQYRLADWNDMWGRLERARAIEPDNPQLEEFLGLVAMRRFDDPDRLRDATPHYVRSIQLRPVAAHTWANLAEARYAVGDTGPMFRLALENAAALAPSNPQVQHVVAVYGLAVFDEVEPPTRRAIESIVAAGMRRDAGEMLAIAQRRGRVDVPCRYLPQVKRKIDPRWPQLCAR